MTKGKDFIGSPEFEALKDIPGVDPAEIMKQAGLGGDPTPPGGGEPPIPAGGEPPTPPAPPIPPQRTDPAPAPQNDILKEIFGDRFKTVEEVKNANIVGQLDELDSLRRTKSDLEKQLSTKPQTNFVNDEVALYNEFVRETGISDYGVFKRLNAADVANMDPVDALVTRYVLEHPNLAGQEDKVRVPQCGVLAADVSKTGRIPVRDFADYLAASFHCTPGQPAKPRLASHGPFPGGGEGGTQGSGGSIAENHDLSVERCFHRCSIRCRVSILTRAS